MSELKNISNFIDKYFQKDNWDDLSINPNVLKKYLKNLLPKKGVVAIRTLPLFENKILKRVHIVALTKISVCHVQVAKECFEFREIPLVDLTIKTIFHFKSKNDLKNIEVHFSTGDLTKEGTPRIYSFLIPAELQNNILAFISQANSFKAEHFRYED